jgi:hypothetical protein
MSEKQPMEKLNKLLPSSPDEPPPLRSAPALQNKRPPTSPDGPPPPALQNKRPTTSPDGPPPLRSERSNQTNQTNQNNQNNNIENKVRSLTKTEQDHLLEEMMNIYLANNPMYRDDKKINEIEIRFGTNPNRNRQIKPISKIDYDNVVSHLYSTGFKTAYSEGQHMLRIYPQYIDPKTGNVKISNIRADIAGIDLVQEYCKTNSIQKILDMPSNSHNKLIFTQKTRPMNKDNTKTLPPIDYADFNFRISYQLENNYNPGSHIIQNMVRKWSDSKKIFRYINRVRFRHPDLPVIVDLSIVKGSKMNIQNKQPHKKGFPIPQYTIQEAGVFETQEYYEIEIEIDNKMVGVGTEFSTTKEIIIALKKSIRIILSGIQGTNYPISYEKQATVLNSYMKLIHGKEFVERFIKPADFVGPSSYTLQKENISQGMSDMGKITILKNYTVTDKADGERKLLYIAENGHIYMCNTNMSIIFTGTVTNEKTIFNTLIDGEHIKYDKKGNFINLYAAFDIYYINDKSVCEYAFVKTVPEIEADEGLDKEIETTKEFGKNQSKEIDNRFRLLLLKQVIGLLKPVSIINHAGSKSGEKDNVVNPCRFNIRCKEFYMDSPDITIFQCCSKILGNVADGVYEYITDGLIFTPASASVGSNKLGVRGPLKKMTWDLSFKWKPEESNTIDFLVSMKKDKTGKDELHNIFQENQNMQGKNSILQYKTIILRCGFDENKDGFLNPFQDMVEDKLPAVVEAADYYNNNSYKPMPFQPTNPSDPTACICNIILQTNGSGDLLMKTEENEYFDEDTIVEFRYDITREPGWRWIPLRVRYDKTAELRSGIKNYGNAYRVANSNWLSLHDPITEDMISTGNGIADTAIDEDKYYNGSNTETNTRSMRDFHNLYVKRKLITGVASRKDTLIDFAVGKAGDLSKWIHSKLSFVYGIDISKDNIHNNLNGACARFLSSRKKYGDNMPRALFVNGNSSLNIRGGDAFNLFTEKDKMVSRAVFGSGAKDRKALGEGVYKQYGVGQDGFNISSVQFALHYFFENITTFHQFIRNVAECTKLNGYFIGTCYDGSSVFRLLKSRNMGESIQYMKDERKIIEITKMYNETGFPDGEESLGYPINVYQESINQTIREYLVNFEFFTRIMENYGFALIPKTKAEHLGFPNSTGLFDELFYSLKNEVMRNPNIVNEYGTALNMSDAECHVSFLNRYFIFQKIRIVSTDAIGKTIEKYSVADIDDKAQNSDSDGDSEYMKLSAKMKDLGISKLGISKADNNAIDKSVVKINEEIGKLKKPFGRKLKAKKIVLENYSPVLDSPIIVLVDNPIVPVVQIAPIAPIVAVKTQKRKTFKLKPKDQREDELAKK